MGIGLCLGPEALLQVQLVSEAPKLLGRHHGHYTQEGLGSNTSCYLLFSHSASAFIHSNFGEFEYIQSAVKEQVGVRCLDAYRQTGR